MNKATRITTVFVGIYAGSLGMAHGFFTVRHGSGSPESLIFNTIGSPCQADAVYHACFPAMTIIPNLLVSGMLALVMSFAIIICSLFFLPKRRGGPVLILLSTGLLLVGGGFIPAFLGIIAGVTSTRINSPLSWWQQHLSESLQRLLSAIWPWMLAAYFALVLGQSVMGNFANAFLMRLGMSLLIMEYVLLLLAIVSAFAHDIQKKVE